jgi:hypothetical protein
MEIIVANNLMSEFASPDKGEAIIYQSCSRGHLSMEGFTPSAFSSHPP